MTVVSSQRQLWPRVRVGFGSLLLALRFFHLGNAPFVLDEPKFQMIIDEHLKAGTFPTHALAGAMNFPYGPMALWMYFIPRMISDHPVAVIAFQGLCVSLGIILLGLAIRRAHGGVAASWTFLLAASSPYLFFYSRHAWDNTFQILFSALGIYGVSRLKSRPVLWAAVVSIGCGSLINTHLMSLPTVIALGLASVITAKRAGEKRWALFSISLLLPALVICFPYFRFLVLEHGSSPHRDRIAMSFLDSIASLAVHLLQTFSYLSQWGFKYFADGSLAVLAAANSAPVALFARVEPWAWILRGVGIFSLGYSIRDLKRTRNPVVFVSVVSTLGLLFLIEFERLGFSPPQFFTHPHYFMGVWFVPFFFTGTAISNTRGLWAKLIRAAAVLTVASNFAFVLAADRLVTRFGGTRGIHYSASVTNLEQVTNELCRTLNASVLGGSVIDIQTTSLFPEPLVYFTRHLELCRRLWTAPVFRKAGATFEIRYAGPPPNANLELHPISAK